MAKRVSRYRLIASALATEVGKVGELIINLTRNSLHVMDGVSPGGYELGRADVSNIQQATSGQNGVMTTTQVAALTTAGSNITTLQGQMTTANTNIATNTSNISSLTTSDAGKIPKVSSPTAGHMALVAADGTLTDGGFAMGKGVSVMSFGSAVPTGWTLDASWNDKMAIGVNGSGGGTNGNTWTISGITVDNHTHDVSVSITTGTAAGATGVVNAGANFTAVSPTHTHAYAGVFTSGAPSVNTITSNATWRPPAKYVAWAQLNA